MQTSLFPVIVKSLRPSPYNTADLKAIAIGRDNMQYACKRRGDHPEMPATEWFCHSIAQAAQIATPPFCTLVIPTTGETCFGSRWEGDLIEAAPLSDDELTQQFFGAARISAVLALDRFLCNPDRHLENFLYRRQPNGSVTAMAFDYSRAWRIICPPFGLSVLPSDPRTPGTCATTQHWQLAKQYGFADMSEAIETVESVAALTAGQVASIMHGMPAGWISLPDQDAVLKWWNGPGLGERLRMTKDWIRNV